MRSIHISDMGGLVRQAAMCLILSALFPAIAKTELTTVRGRVEVVGSGKARRPIRPTAVVWLTPLIVQGSDPVPAVPVPPNLKLIQKNKSFEPHILIVPVGASVEFPNHDPFFHNVFSLFEGKKFDLGLYEAGTSRVVRFTRPGISYIFCNIHPEMSAVIITLATPWYALSNGDGQVVIPDVPYGRYRIHIWNEGMGPDSKETSREITIGEGSNSLGMIRVVAASGEVPAHKNKYGRDYDAPTPDSSVYSRQR